ncbi:MAG: ThuA domain-containing protein [Planctomycetota bacterium]|nr:ThuA domain-containing protein [Planctomycetota bacterium]
MRHATWARAGLIVLLALAVTAWAGDAKIQALIITGDDVGGHPWKETTPVTQEILTKSGKFDVKAVEGFTVLDNKEELGKYGLIVFMLYNNKKAPISDAAKENLLSFVKDGKGFVVSHLASASFPQWKEWGELCGRYWTMGKSGHGPRSEFLVKVVKKDDPIVKGIEDFKADDELYAKLFGDTKINVLLEADSDWSKKTEPIAWTIDVGKGRVFHHTFGHDAKALQIPAVQKLIARGCEWAATGKVAD